MSSEYLDRLAKAFSNDSDLKVDSPVSEIKFSTKSVDVIFKLISFP